MENNADDDDIHDCAGHVVARDDGLIANGLHVLRDENSNGKGRRDGFGGHQVHHRNGEELVAFDCTATEEVEQVLDALQSLAYGSSSPSNRFVLVLIAHYGTRCSHLYVILKP